MNIFELINENFLKNFLKIAIVLAVISIICLMYINFVHKVKFEKWINVTKLFTNMHSQLKSFLINQNGFSLIEFSIVMVLCGVIMMQSISFLSTLKKIKCDAKTIEHKKIIIRAIKGYYAIYKCLPAPSQEKEGGTCMFHSQDNIKCAGYIPFRDLGIPEEVAKDGYGEYFLYFVNKNYIIVHHDSSMDIQSDIPPLTVHDLKGHNVISKPFNSAQNNNAVIFVIISVDLNKPKQDGRHDTDIDQAFIHNLSEFKKNCSFTLTYFHSSRMKVWWVAANSFIDHDIKSNNVGQEGCVNNNSINFLNA